MEFQFIDFRLDTIIVRKYLWLHACQGTPSWDAKCKKEVSFYHKNETYSEKFRDSSLIIFFLWKANMRAYWITNAFLKISITNPKSKQTVPGGVFDTWWKTSRCVYRLFWKLYQTRDRVFRRNIKWQQRNVTIKMNASFYIFFRGYSRLNVKCRWISLWWNS